MQVSTAVLVAQMRAHHARYDAHRIFDDGIAAQLISPQEAASLERRHAQMLARLHPGIDVAGLDPAARIRALPRARRVLALVVARARYAEDRLAEAIEAGCAQYVILGAGLDSFACRRGDLAGRLRVFELDRAAAQASKRARLAAAAIACPANLHYLPIDFEREAAGEVLARCAAWRPDRPAFLAWLGVSYYLTRAAFFDTLRSLHSATAPGSRAVFDHLDLHCFDAARSSPRVAEMLEAVQELGEPMITGFDPRALPGELAAAGWRVLEALEPARIQERYFAGRDDGLGATEHFHFLLAERA